MARKQTKHTAPDYNPEEEFSNLKKAALNTLKDLLRNGSAATRLRASVWILERMDKKEGNLPQTHTIEDRLRELAREEELRIGYDDED